MFRPRWWRGLFARVTLAYAIGSLLLSVGVAVFSYTLVAERLLTETDNTAQEQVWLNSTDIQKRLQNTKSLTEEELDELVLDWLADDFRTSNLGDSIVIPSDGKKRSTLLEADIPSDVRSAVQEGEIVQKRYLGKTDQGDIAKLYIIGVPLIDADAEYYEVVPYAPLEKTLGDFRNILTGVAFISSIFGAVLGYYAARQAVAPVSRISNAAESIAAGDFDTRLDMEVDPDLSALSKSFNEMVEQLSFRIERDERFASDVSHELRSPLMTLAASVEVLERRKDSLPEVAQQAVTLLSDDLTRFQNLVQDLLEISRLDAGAVQLQLSPFLLREFLENIIAQSKNPGIELLFEEEDNDLAIKADKRRLAQVITNLIENGAKYGEGITEITFQGIDEDVQITVEDKGPGILPEDRMRVFERFGRISSDAGKRASGTGVGLGLSLVSEHVRAHGGQVWVTDRIDGHHGARFVVELPVRMEEHNDEEMAV